MLSQLLVALCEDFFVYVWLVFCHTEFFCFSQKFVLVGA